MQRLRNLHNIVDTGKNKVRKFQKDPKLCFCNQDIWSKIVILVEYIMCHRHMFLENMLYNITMRRESFYSTVILSFFTGYWMNDETLCR